MKTEDHDVISLVASYRPTPEMLDERWPETERLAMLERVRGGDRDDVTATRRVTRGAHIPRRWIAIGTVVVGAAAAAVLASTLLPARAPGGAQPAAAAALERLAGTVLAAPADLAGPHQFRHVVQRNVQNGVVQVQESWIAADGRVWRRDAWGHQVNYWLFPPGAGTLSEPTPAFLAGLPTDAAALQRYLREHVTGSMSTDEAVFVAVADILRGNFAPAGLRAAAIRVVERTPHVTNAGDTRDALGRTALHIEFTDQRIRPGETYSLLFDPTTAMLLEERDSGAGTTFVGTVVKADIIDAVPDAVRAKAGHVDRANVPPPTGPAQEQPSTVPTSKPSAVPTPEPSSAPTPEPTAAPTN